MSIIQEEANEADEADGNTGLNQGRIFGEKLEESDVMMTIRVSLEIPSMIY